MNTAGNKKYQETEERIMKAFGSLASRQSIEEINVSDICREAGIHRTTFYGHYEGMYELQMKFEEYQLERTMQTFIEDGRWDIRAGMLRQIRYFYRYQDIIRKHIASGSTEFNVSISYFDRVASVNRKSYMRHFGLKTDTEMQYHYEYHRAGSMAIIRSWIMRGCKEAPEEITDYLVTFYGLTKKQKETV